MKFLSIFASILCILPFSTTVAANLAQRQLGINDIPRSDSLVDCTKFKTDHAIIDSFPFDIPLNSILQSSEETYGFMDENDNVYYLNIANQKYVPSSIFCFKHLKELYVRKTSFQDVNGGLPAAIERFAPTLTNLGIYDTIITHLPEQIGKLRHLKLLVLSNTGLVTLPDSIGNLLSLTQIVLSHNPHLRSIQPLNGHPYLKFLQTDNCPIDYIPVNLPQLTNLYMFNNNLTNLVGIRTLGNGTDARKYFYFDQNSIQSIPPQIQQVKNLYFLKLENNKLTMLPSDIFNITTLHDLFIRNNSFNRTILKAIVTKFKITNPSLNLIYRSKRTPWIKLQ